MMYPGMHQVPKHEVYLFHIRYATGSILTFDCAGIRVGDGYDLGN